MGKLEKINLRELSAGLEKPFKALTVARVGDVILSMCLCAGQMCPHRHVDFDEMFWVYDGIVDLVTEIGSETLRAGDVTVVPKGVEHWSVSETRSIVLLMRCGVVPHRKNGRRRLFAALAGMDLVHLSIGQAANDLRAMHEFKTVAHLEGSALQVGIGEGSWVVDVPAPHDELLCVWAGTASVQTHDATQHLRVGEISVVREGEVYHLSTSRDSILVRVTHIHRDDNDCLGGTHLGGEDD